METSCSIVLYSH